MVLMQAGHRIVGVEYHVRDIVDMYQIRPHLEHHHAIGIALSNVLVVKEPVTCGAKVDVRKLV